MSKTEKKPHAHLCKNFLRNFCIFLIQIKKSKSPKLFKRVPRLRVGDKQQKIPLYLFQKMSHLVKKTKKLEKL